MLNQSMSPLPHGQCDVHPEFVNPFHTIQTNCTVSMVIADVTIVIIVGISLLICTLIVITGLMCIKR